MKTFLYTLLNCFVTSFAILWLWEWFLVPAGMNSITFINAVGLCVFYNFLTAFAVQKEPDDPYDPALVGLLALVVGWILHLFM